MSGVASASHIAVELTASCVTAGFSQTSCRIPFSQQALPLILLANYTLHVHMASFYNWLKIIGAMIKALYVDVHFHDLKHVVLHFPNVT